MCLRLADELKLESWGFLHYETYSIIGRIGRGARCTNHRARITTW